MTEKDKSPKRFHDKKCKNLWERGKYFGFNIGLTRSYVNQFSFGIKILKKAKQKSNKNCQKEWWVGRG